MRNQTYAVVDAISVLTWDRWAAGRGSTTDDFREFVYHWVVSNAALYRFARMVGGAPNTN